MFLQICNSYGSGNADELYKEIIIGYFFVFDYKRPDITGVWLGHTKNAIMGVLTI